jgi:hypothetical protein
MPYVLCPHVAHKCGCRTLKHMVHIVTTEPGITRSLPRQADFKMAQGRVEGFARGYIRAALGGTEPRLFAQRVSGVCCR